MQGRACSPLIREVALAHNYCLVENKDLHTSCNQVTINILVKNKVEFRPWSSGRGVQTRESGTRRSGTRRLTYIYTCYKLKDLEFRPESLAHGGLAHGV